MKVTNCLYCENINLSFVTTRSDGIKILKCQRCRLMMVEEVSNDTRSIYTQKYFEKKQKDRIGYDDYLTLPAANLLGKYAFARLFVLNNEKAHLDLGCADGSLIEIFEQEGFISQGLEISLDAVEKAKIKGINVLQSDLQYFPNYKTKFDLITAFDLLEHLEKLRDTLREIKRNLKNNGHFIFTTLLVKNYMKDYWFSHSLEHYIYFDIDSLSYILSEIFGPNSFTLIETRSNGVYEILGVVKCGELTYELEKAKSIYSPHASGVTSEDGYLLSLLFGKLSKFGDSQKLIKKFTGIWPEVKCLEAKFYNLYFQGKFEKAVHLVLKERKNMATKNAIFWQALCHAQDVLFNTIIKQCEDENEKIHKKIIEEKKYSNMLEDELSNLNKKILVKIAKKINKI